MNQSLLIRNLGRRAAAGFRPRTCSQERPAAPAHPRPIKQPAGDADGEDGGVAVFWLALAGVVLLALAALGALVAAGWLYLIHIQKLLGSIPKRLTTYLNENTVF